ncbi:iron-containing redox enzyme family protein [Novipirellula sp.]|uniref:iron-containing redox enzyme family protein n=1 Tax=Novipirellula sp. TaxID=2795430 RepID=UPI003563E3BD
MPFSTELKSRSKQVLREFQASDTFQGIFHSRTDPEFIRVVIRRVLFEVATYGPFITSASFTAIGRLCHQWPRVEALAMHLSEEARHPQLAMDGFLLLGGDHDEAAECKLSPAAFAVAAVCEQCGRSGHPAGYLGFMYLMEFTTITLATQARKLLASANLQILHVDMHSKVDIEHVALLDTEINALVESLPETRSAILDGFDRFAAVYPLPLWKFAYETARGELECQRQPTA